MITGIYDLETSGFKADSSILLCCAFKTFEKKEPVQILRADHYKSWKTNRLYEKEFIKDVLDHLNHFQILVAHNGEYFDKTYLNSKAIQYGLDPIMRRKMTIDPCLASRKHMALGRNSLAAIIDYLEIPVKKTPIELKKWKMAEVLGDTKSMDLISKHCKYDILTLEQVYKRVLSLIEKVDKRGSAY